jgi:hypothetical protein
METIVTRVQKVLQMEFSPREIRLESAGRGKVSGWIISKSFDELTDDERYQKVWRLLDAYLSKKDRDRILGFFTFTPLEEKMISDENFDILDTSSRKKSSSVRKKRANSDRKKSRTRQKRR